MTQVENRRLELNRVVPNFTLPALDEEELPDMREMIGWLQLLEIECPE